MPQQSYTLEQLQGLGATPAGMTPQVPAPERGPQGGKEYSLDDLQKLNAQPVMSQDINVNIPGHAPPPSIPSSDTGVIAGALRGLSNLNPLNLIPSQHPFDPLAGLTPEQRVE